MTLLPAVRVKDVLVPPRAGLRRDVVGARRPGLHRLVGPEAQRPLVGTTVVAALEGQAGRSADEPLIDPCQFIRPRRVGQAGGNTAIVARRQVVHVLGELDRVAVQNEAAGARGRDQRVALSFGEGHDRKVGAASTRELVQLARAVVDDDKQRRSGLGRHGRPVPRLHRVAAADQHRPAPGVDALVLGGCAGAGIDAAERHLAVEPRRSALVDRIERRAAGQVSREVEQRLASSPADGEVEGLAGHDAGRCDEDVVDVRLNERGVREGLEQAADAGVVVVLHTPVAILARARSLHRDTLCLPGVEHELLVAVDDEMRLAQECDAGRVGPTVTCDIEPGCRVVDPWLQPPRPDPAGLGIDRERLDELGAVLVERHVAARRLVRRGRGP